MLQFLTGLKVCTCYTANELWCQYIDSVTNHCSFTVFLYSYSSFFKKKKNSHTKKRQFQQDIPLYAKGVISHGAQIGGSLGFCQPTLLYLRYKQENQCEEMHDGKNVKSCLDARPHYEISLFSLQW